MLRWFFPSLLVACLSLVGCGSSGVPFNDDSQDTEKFAVLIRQVVAESVADARKSSEPADQIRLISDAVRGGNKPVGQYGEIYQRLGVAANELTEACERADGPTPDLGKKLDELLAIAEELPGSSEVAAEPRL